MQARLDQSGMEPGDKMTLRVLLTEYDVPLQRAEVIARITNPDHSIGSLILSETEPGIYTEGMIASMAGIYHFNIGATGVDYKARPFTREQILDGAVFLGGNSPKDIIDGRDGRIPGKDTCCTSYREFYGSA